MKPGRFLARLKLSPRNRRNPLDAVIACDSHRFRRGIDLEKRPWPWNERVFLDHALVDLHTETRTLGHDQIAAIELQRLAQNFVRQREWIHPRPAVIRVTWIFQPFDNTLRPANPQMRGSDHFQQSPPTVERESQSF